jgi:hypothetical protein
MNRGIKINFAHRTFKWSNEAGRRGDSGKAAVYCVIIGFSLADRGVKKLYHYADVSGNAVESVVNHINAYLVDGADIFINSAEKPICAVPEMCFGNMPADEGHLIFSRKEKHEFLKKEPNAAPYFRRLIGAREFINNGERWCLWLEGVEPVELRKMKLVYERVKAVKAVREQSARPELAATPHLFAQITQPRGKSFILIPSTSSENRDYIPIGFFSSRSIASNSCHIIPGGNRYHFGVLTSTMHMTWMRYVCGRLKSDYRYSKNIVYNNFPWPTPTGKQKSAIEEAAQAILDTRTEFPESSLADLYDPVAMPPKLTKAHQKLDKAVEKAYGREFDDDAQRVAYLFELYQKLNAGLFVDTKKRGKGRKV